METHWKCLNCGETEGVVNGVCPTCGPTQTLPVSEEAKVEAGADEATAQKAAEDAVVESQRAKEAEERNQASIDAGKK